MFARRIAAFLLLLPLLLANAWAKSNDPKPDSSHRLTRQERIDIIRAFSAELCFARVQFPMGQKGLVLKDGKMVSPTPEQMQQMLVDYGPAVKPGDRTQITAVEFKDNYIRFEINGGPVRKQKWYQHIQWPRPRRLRHSTVPVWAACRLSFCSTLRPRWARC